MKKSFPLIVLLILNGTSVLSQNISFTDPDFKAFLLRSSAENSITINLNGNAFNIDQNNDGEIEIAEALQVSELDLNCWPSLCDGLGFITSIDGVRNFTNLKSLKCRNGHLTALDVSGLIELEYLDCRENFSITNLDVGGCFNLIELYCSGNQLTYLDLSAAAGLNNLTYLNCGGNQITSLNISGLTNLNSVNASSNLISDLNIDGTLNIVSFLISSNNITSLDISNRPLLGYLELSFDSLLSSLNISGCPSLSQLGCMYTQIVSIDLSYCTSYVGVAANGNQSLSYINLKNQHVDSVGFDNCPNIQAICCDEEEFVNLQYVLADYGMTETCQLSTDCANMDITAFIKENKVSIYPNPASNVLRLSNIDQKTNVKICNIDGKIIRDTFAFPDTDVNIEAIENGLYFIVLDNKLTLKFLKE